MLVASLILKIKHTHTNIFVRPKLRFHLQTNASNEPNKQSAHEQTERTNILPVLCVCCICCSQSIPRCLCHSHLSFSHFKLSADWYVCWFTLFRAKFRKKILSLGQNFWILPIWSEVLEWHFALCRVPPKHCGTLHQGCEKYLFVIFYQFWPPYGRKFPFGTFHLKTGKKSWREILITTGVKCWSACLLLCLPKFFLKLIKFSHYFFKIFKFFSVSLLDILFKIFINFTR